MQPLGRKKIRFPSKTKEWLGKGVRMWWETITDSEKKTDRQHGRREIEKEMKDNIK